MGEAVGARVGGAVEEAVGAGVGYAVGSAVVGAAVGDAVGAEVTQFPHGLDSTAFSTVKHHSTLLLVTVVHSWYVTLWNVKGNLHVSPLGLSLPLPGTVATTG